MPGISQPVTLAVTTDKPARFAAANPPYTLLNLSVTGTAWIADNPGIQAGQGQPLYPGASLAWNAPGAIWLIGDENFSVIASQDITDWQPNPVALATAILNSGLILVDQPELIFNGSLDNAASDVFDITTFQSLYVTITPVDTVTFPTSTPRFDLIWYEDAAGASFEVMKRTLRWADTAGNSAAFKGVFPAIGAGFKVISQGAVSGADVQIVASHRPLHLMQQALYANNGNALYYSIENIAGAGGQFLAPLPPYIGECTWRATVSAGTHTTSVLDVQEAIGGATATRMRDVFNQAGTTSLWQAVLTVQCVGTAQRLRIVNNDASARDFTISVIPSIGAQGMY